MKDLRTFSIPTESVVPVLGALAVLSALLSLCLGAVPVAPGEVLAALLGRGSGTAASIVLYARLPRTCGCLLAGAALAVWDGAGARSPLTWAAGILAALICLSTVFIKQHALADVAGGLILSLLAGIPVYRRSRVLRLFPRQAT